MGSATAISRVLGRGATDRRSLGWVCAGLAILGVAWATVAAKPDLNIDTLPGLLAVEQRLQGHSNALSEIITADPADLNRDRVVPVSWWPPAQQVLVYWLRTRHLTIGEAVKIIVFASWVIGLGGWITWFVMTVRDPRLVPWFVTAFVLLRASHTSAFIYSGGDTLLWAIFPAVAVLTIFAMRTRGMLGLILAAVSGAGSGFLVLVRYVGAILAMGVGLAWISSLVRRRARAVEAAAWMIGAGGAVFVAYGILSPLIHHQTPASEVLKGDLAVMLGVSATGPLFAISDGIEALTKVMLRFGFGPTEALETGLLALLVGTVFVTWLLIGYRRVPDTPAENRRLGWTLGVSVTLTTSATLAILWSRGAIVSWEARHHQYGAFLLLPFFWEALLNSLRTTRNWGRVTTALCLVVFMAFPVAYGVSTLVRRSVFADSAARAAVSRTGVSIFWTNNGANADAFQSEMNGFPWFRSALLVTPSKEIALTVPDHRVLFLIDRDTPLNAGFHGRPSAVALVVPPWMEVEQIARVRRSFADITQWTKIPLKSAPSTEVWLGQ